MMFSSLGNITDFPTDDYTDPIVENAAAEIAATTVTASTPSPVTPVSAAVTSTSMSNPLVFVAIAGVVYWWVMKKHKRIL